MKKLLVHLLRALYWIFISPIFVILLGYIILYILLPTIFLLWLNNEKNYWKFISDFTKSFIYGFILCMPSKAVKYF